jgi:RNA polymerase sigma factor (sigma-70 family)
MAELTDHELLTVFARTGAESAFATLVQRHINLVYSAALRFTGDDTLAADITQAVFILLARKAGGISAKIILTGWLYQTARLMAANALKQKIRRQNREQEAFMQSTLTHNEMDEAWKQIAPVLDDAMGALGETDRNAVLLRYFESKPLAEVGTALGVSEDAARVRVNRALEKLRGLMTRKGVTLGATAIAGAVTAKAVTAAPVTLASTITTAALTGTTLTLTTIAMTTFQKIAVTAALTLTVGAGFFEAKQAHDVQGELTGLQAQQAPQQEQIQQLQSDLADASNTIAGLKEEFARNQKDNTELLRLRGEVGVLQSQLKDASASTAKTAVAMRGSSQSTNDFRNLAILDFLGNPVPPPANLDAAYTKEGLMNAIQTAAQMANVSVERVEIDDSEFPYLVAVTVDNKADREALESKIKGMNQYVYSGGISSDTTTVFNMTPGNQFPVGTGSVVGSRLMVRQMMIMNKITGPNSF